MDEDALRAEFEAWLFAEYHERPKRSGDGYWWQTQDRAWRSWKESTKRQQQRGQSNE